MNASAFVVLALGIVLPVAGCGGLSEAATQACSEGKATVARARTFVDNGPPEVMVELARSASPKFGELAGKADDDDVRAALSGLAGTFADFRPDMSRRPTALRRDAGFDRYIEDFKAGVGRGADELAKACS